MGRGYVALNIKDVFVDSLNCFSLFSYHVSKLSEDLAQFGNGGFNRFNSGRALLNVCIL